MLFTLYLHSVICQQKVEPRLSFTMRSSSVWYVLVMSIYGSNILLITLNCNYSFTCLHPSVNLRPVTCISQSVLYHWHLM